MGALIFRVLPPALEAALRPTFEHVYLTGEPADAEVDVGLGSRARVLDLQVVATATGLAAICRDVTDARLAERRRQAEERIANAIFEGSPVGIQVFDGAGTSERMNEAQLKLLGLGGRQSLFNVLHDPLAVATGEAGAFARAYQGEIVDDFEYDADLGAPENVWSTRRDWASFTRTVFPLLADDGSVTGVVSFLREITERKRLERRLGYLAYHDPLTDLANRELFSTQLGHALRARRPGYVAVAFVDLDDFKRVNDRSGHAAGDELLCHVANALTADLREGDLAARLGGDEFGVLLDDVPSESAARRVISRLVESVTRPVTIGGVEISASASVGLVLAVRGLDPEAVIRDADRCMYAAKTDGKGRIHQRSRPLQPRVTDPAEVRPTPHRRRRIA